MALSKSAREQIKWLPGDDGWWRSASEQEFIDIADILVTRHDVPEDKVLLLLKQAYVAMSSEFGQ